MSSSSAGSCPASRIEKVQQKNAITRAVGVYERVEVDTLVMELIAGDTLILASDGLHGYLETPEELAAPLALEGDASVKALVELANARGGKDNITTVVVKVGEEGAVDAERAKRLALKRDVLANMPLFSRLTERELLRVMQAVEVREYKDGDLVILEGDKGDELFIVLEGKVRVSRGEQTLLDLGPGEHVGEMALIRSVPRSASVHAVGPAELIAIRRQDFFEILRKEHEVAVKMLWQFLGVLADRLDQTSSALHNAKRELAAEDMTAEIFPENRLGHRFDAPAEPLEVKGVKGRGRLASFAVLGSALACEPQKASEADAAPTSNAAVATASAAPSAAAEDPSARMARWEEARNAALRIPCRAIAVDGPVREEAAGDAGVALALQGEIPSEVWLSVARDGRLVAKDPRTTRETTFVGPARVRACVAHREESWVATGHFDSAIGAGETPGAEEWVVTPLGVVRYMAAKLGVDVRAKDAVVAVGSGVAFLWLDDGVRVALRAGADAGRGREHERGRARGQARRERGRGRRRGRGRGRGRGRRPRRRRGPRARRRRVDAGLRRRGHPLGRRGAGGGASGARDGGPVHGPRAAVPGPGRDAPGRPLDPGWQHRKRTDADAPARARRVRRRGGCVSTRYPHRLPGRKCRPSSKSRAPPGRRAPRRPPRLDCS